MPTVGPDIVPWLRRMAQADALEAAGDAAGALEVLERAPLGPDGRPWWRPERWRRLSQLVELGDAAPAWAHGRWIVAQAAQRAPRDHQRLLDLAVETRGGQKTLWGVDAVDEMAKVMDHDWVFRQLVLHEHGGLAAFLRDTASPTLVRGCPDVRSWVGVPMGAYRLLAETPDRILWWDLVGERAVRTHNMGGAALVAEGECVLGRVVEADGVELFESAPLCVPTAVAETVAAAPEDWLAAVSAGCRGPVGELLGTLVSRLHDFDLLTDLPARARDGYLGTPEGAAGDGTAGKGDDGPSPDGDLALVLAAIAERLDVTGTEGGCGCGCDCAACEAPEGRPLSAAVAAALLEPGTTERLQPLLVPADASALDLLAEVLPAPADVVCDRLARELRREGAGNPSDSPSPRTDPREH